MKENVTREAIVLVIDNDGSVRAALKALFDSVGLEVRLYASAECLPGNPHSRRYELLGPRCSVARHEWDQSSRCTVEIWRFPAHRFRHRPWRCCDGRARDEGRCNRFSDQALPKPRHTGCGFRGPRTGRRPPKNVAAALGHTGILSVSQSARARSDQKRSAGKLNKQTAAELGLSEVTVKVHRASAMRKMHATSLAHLIKMLEHVEEWDIAARSPNLVTA